MTVEFGGAAIAADVAFTGIATIETGDPRNDMAWPGMAVENGGFARRNAPDGTISGRLYAHREEKVGGEFECDGIAGAFGGSRAAD